MSLADIRREYDGAPLDETRCDPDPLVQFEVWLAEVRHLEADPTAMALATASKEGRPSVRTVLLKGVGAGGFLFFTNYESRKARELSETGRASLLFYWPSMNRQVRVDGVVSPISDAESDAYFESRPIESRIAAVVSHQSTVLESRATLDAMFEAARRQWPEGPIPRPAFWGGYRVDPDEIEFWQGRTNRLHDRLRYQKQADGQWIRHRLAP